MACQALRDVPEVNAAWMGDFIRQYHSVDVSVAVQTPHGLMVPVTRNTDRLGLQDINAAVKQLANKVRRPSQAGRPSAALLTVRWSNRRSLQQHCEEPPTAGLQAQQ
jgi:2-oxoacid dehydrogenases acyltransferase (catalytic domain)